MSTRQRLVVVGNGMAGIRTLEELLGLAPDLYDITVFGAEPHPNYNRILLSPVLAGQQAFQDIVLNDLDWYRRHGIDLRLDCKAVRIDRARRMVHGADGSQAPYDRLLLATGSRPYMLPVPGRDLQGVIGFRDAADVGRMIAAAERGGEAVVIGGGLLGLEAASGLAARGMRVSVVHLGQALLDRQLDVHAAQLLQHSLQARGLRFLMGRQTQALLDDGNGHVRGVRLADGEEISADLVVMAVGIRPDTGLAEQCGLRVDRGVVVSDTLQTYDPRIYAVGECASHRGACYGLVAPLFEQARVAANHLALHGIGRYPGSVTSTRLKVTGVELYSAGDFAGGDGAEFIVLSDARAGIYKKLVVKDDRLVGACLYGDTDNSAWYFRLIREGQPIGALRDALMLGEDAAGCEPAQPEGAGPSGALASFKEGAATGRRAIP
ncbi:assimilatory nitrite reductase large subunit [Bordetella genomosp. 13]|uniref:Assimilatory nitrite reductase large subunit n=1 Tax=Bordetella genomosp. 13 TaxID=463040 RepID=A0A1W6Z9J0_9BORD|nr:assimilatory nitrite reductase large subunit [Bordetella genomosp. 13]